SDLAAVISPATPVAGQIHFSAPVAPVAGIIKVAANASEVFVAAQSVSPDTASAIEPAQALFANALVEVSNGSGIERSGARFRAYLRGRGVPIRRLTNASRFGFAETILFYRDGFFEAAQTIALELPMPIALRRNDGQRSDLRLRLGLDSKPFDNYLVAGIVTASQ
ncbi:MAG: LytR C-terminal domain-containing protein, partial [Pseudomonadota bacterium]